jgi:putative transposase
MRHVRIKAEGPGYYHCMSRIIERRYVLGPAEKQRLHNLLRSLAAFGGIEILAYCLLSNHFHILAQVPEKREITDSELIERLGHIFQPCRVRQIATQLKDLRDQGMDRAAEAFKARYTYRMYDISEFFKALKQQFSQYYNRRESRRGTLWESRFKSILVEGSEHALLTMAAYIDLNAVRAGLVKDPKDWRWSSYGAATGGDRVAREGLVKLMEAAGCGRLAWVKAREVYRERLYVQGQEKGR